MGPVLSGIFALIGAAMFIGFMVLLCTWDDINDNRQAKRQHKRQLERDRLTHQDDEILSRTMQLIAATLAEDALVPIFSEKMRGDYARLLVEYNDRKRELARGS